MAACHTSSVGVHVCVLCVSERAHVWALLASAIIKNKGGTLTAVLTILGKKESDGTMRQLRLQPTIH